MNYFNDVKIETRVYNKNTVIVEFTYNNVTYVNGVDKDDLEYYNMLPQTFVFKRIVEPFVQVSGIKYNLDQLHEFNTSVYNLVSKFIKFPKEI